MCYLIVEYVFPDQDPTKTHECCVYLTLFTPREQVYVDLSGRFTIKLIVIYDFDSTKRLVEPLNNRQKRTINTDWYLINNGIYNGGIMPKIYVLDTESSLELKTTTMKK